MVRVGQRLQTVRVKKSLTLEEIAKATKIKQNFLVAIEKGEYNKLPSPAYAQGFVRNYADYLGLPKAEITALFKREFDERKAYKVLPDGFAQTKEFPITHIRIQQSLVVGCLLLLLVVGFLIYQYRFVFFAPYLTLQNPKQNSIISQNVDITGQTDSNATVIVNNEPAIVNSNGLFNKELSLFPGKAIITVIAKNKFGKQSIIQQSVTVR